MAVLLLMWQNDNLCNINSITAVLNTAVSRTMAPQADRCGDFLCDGNKLFAVLLLMRQKNAFGY